MKLERIRQKLEALWEDGYAVETLMRRYSTAVAIIAVLLGVAVLLTGW